MVLRVIDFQRPTAFDFTEDAVCLVTEDYGVVRADFSTSGQGSFLNTMCAAGALLCNVKFPVHIDDVVGTRLLTEPTPCTCLGVYPYETIIRSLDGVLGARLDAGGIRTMLAKKRQIGHFNPGHPTPLQRVDLDPEVAG